MTQSIFEESTSLIIIRGGSGKVEDRLMAKFRGDSLS